MKGLIVDGNNDDDQKIYSPMAWMSDNDENSSRYFGDILQLTNWILDSGGTCHMIPQVSYFIPGLLDDMDKYIEVADGHHVMTKQKQQAEIKMWNDNGDNFNRKLHNVRLVPDLCNSLSSIITLMNLGHTSFFFKSFCMVYFGIKEKKWLFFHMMHTVDMQFGQNKTNI